MLFIVFMFCPPLAIFLWVIGYGDEDEE